MTPFRAAPPPPAALVCPRDGSSLAVREAEGATLHVCARCAGLWIDAAELDALRSDRTRMDGLALHPLATSTDGRPARGTPSPEAATPLACPRCGKGCEAHGYRSASDLVVDVCRTHGMWLDGGELHELIREEREGHRRAKQDPTARALAAATPDPPPPRSFEADERWLRALGVLYHLWRLFR